MVFSNSKIAFLSFLCSNLSLIPDTWLLLRIVNNVRTILEQQGKHVYIPDLRLEAEFNLSHQAIHYYLEITIQYSMN